MKRFFFVLSAVSLSVGLAACTSATNSNTNTVVLDLVNEATNTAPALNQSAPAGTVNATLNTNAVVNGNTPGGAGSGSAGKTNTSTTTAITITPTGFSPSTVTVKVGTVVTWTNSSGDTARVSSDPHPTHTSLPGFDSTTLAAADTYAYTFTKVGTWGYHNHEDPALTGTVIVQ